MSIYEYEVNNINHDGKTSLSNYRGKVMLIVNTATRCGFTPQYTGLQELYSKYHVQGLEILDFPCNQFGNQAAESETEINEFCTGNFGIQFPQFGKIEVNGKDEDPLYTFLKKQKGGLLGSKIKWNFTKFLVDREGNVVERYAPTDEPKKLEADIIKLLG